MWNIFQNDLLYFIKTNKCIYADEHQFYESEECLDVVEEKLQKCALDVTSWYDANRLKGNFKKYSSMLINKTDKKELSIQVKDFRVEPKQNLTLSQHEMACFRRRKRCGFLTETHVSV